MTIAQKHVRNIPAVSRREHVLNREPVMGLRHDDIPQNLNKNTNLSKI